MTRNQSVRPLLLLAAFVAVTGGCTGASVDPMGMQIVQDVSPIQPTAIDAMCVKVNTGVKKGFTDDVFKTIRDLGMKAQSMQSAFAGECSFWLQYDATWDGFPEYLVSAHVAVYQGNTQLGHVLYDASHGGGRPDRYGSAIGKVRPLIEGMFHHVHRRSDTASSP